MQTTALTTVAAPTARPLIPAARHTRASLRLMLDRIMTGESRRFAESHLQVRLHVHLCDTWLGPAGWCMQSAGHTGGCLPIPASYDPAEDQS